MMYDDVCMYDDEDQIFPKGKTSVKDTLHSIKVLCLSSEIRPVF